MNATQSSGLPSVGTMTLPRFSEVATTPSMTSTIAALDAIVASGRDQQAGRDLEICPEELTGDRAEAVRNLIFLSGLLQRGFLDLCCRTGDGVVHSGYDFAKLVDQVAKGVIHDQDTLNAEVFFRVRLSMLAEPANVSAPRVRADSPRC